jgi:two-component system, chemotaxis family, sensor kinase CheA
VIAVGEKITFWNLKLEIASDVAFPSIVIREIYRRLNAASGFSLEGIEPDIFPGAHRSEEEIDTVFSYILQLGTAADVSTIKESLKRAFKGATGITKLGLASARRLEATQEKLPPKTSTEVVPAAPIRGRDHGSMRVDLVKIEDLVNLIGELIINKNQVDSLSQAILQNRNGAEVKHQITDFQAAKNQLNYVTSKLRDLALGIRMIPIGQTLRKFPAAVREMARKQGKMINVVIEGGETELDKAIIEEISDPLLHMIRNAVDHGIESPAEREQKGKTPEGTILIRAEHEGDRISILVEDDGAGLRVEKIRAKALAKGIISEIEAAKMLPREIFQLIFSPGFSTADTISDLSGRGVGMDVVKSNITRLNGLVEVESGPDAGTRITLKLPLTLSILEGLLLEDMNQIYAIPLIAIEKASRIEVDNLKRVGRYWLIEKNGHTLPVFRIAELFGSAGENEVSEYHLIEASAADGRFGLMVQKILGRQEIVLKPLGDYLGTVTGVSGSTILGNGRVALILDTKTIADSVKTILEQEHR